ncbi:reverse transcriptase-like protein [Sphingomonas solaris]|uniref:Reverse transcriptase-like protein n=1 Tax=Alterirhizorhabdus solaris TaxID=2529389 RepID=A0A558R5W0_9SPHN|nr:reverse transcriptase-like protein [Sphingomonas solaris]TVV74757.1 reverse transcriptase-like protein [Sphingomonas solaris]
MKIFFDGGCQPNPGPMQVAVVMAGSTYVKTDMVVGDNNEAEWSALLYAVGLAAAAGLREAVFVGDSRLVIEQASGRWKCRSPHLKPYLTAFEQAVAAMPVVKLRHVTRSRNLAGIALAAVNETGARRLYSRGSATGRGRGTDPHDEDQRGG